MTFPCLPVSAGVPQLGQHAQVSHSYNQGQVFIRVTANSKSGCKGVPAPHKLLLGFLQRTMADQAAASPRGTTEKRHPAGRQQVCYNLNSEMSAHECACHSVHRGQACGLSSLLTRAILETEPCLLDRCLCQPGHFTGPR